MLHFLFVFRILHFSPLAEILPPDKGMVYEDPPSGPFLLTECGFCLQHGWLVDEPTQDS